MMTMMEWILGARKTLAFNDVASDETKLARALIQKAARRKLRLAADEAANGEIRNAQNLQHDATTLHSLAISITLDMRAMGL